MGETQMELVTFHIVPSVIQGEGCFLIVGEYADGERKTWSSCKSERGAEKERARLMARYITA
jgi:hypothetical protein